METQFPTKQGRLVIRDKKLLSELPIAAKGVCVGVKNSSSSFLKYLDRNNIALGNTIKVLSKEEFDDSLAIEIEGNLVNVSHQIATNLYIKPDN